VTVAALCLATAAFGVVFRHPIANVVALAASDQPSSYTQLYFTNPNGLPESLSRMRPNRFGFTVVNHEGRDATLPYVVTLTTSNGTVTIARGAVDLRNNCAATRLINVHSIRRATEYFITVGLVGQNEMIRFGGVTQ
jgi:hypothetical protein